MTEPTFVLDSQTDGSYPLSNNPERNPGDKNMTVCHFMSVLSAEHSLVLYE